MSEYQAVYDAVRSRINNVDVGSAVEAAIRDAGISHAVEMVRQSLQCAAYSMERPSVLYRPEIYMDGDQWCALYGADLMAGVAGFGNSPHEAMRAFDDAWGKSLNE